MPWRIQAEIYSCAVCEARAAKACLRCGRHLCDEHSPAQDTVCDGCEADFAHREAAIIKPQPAPIKGAFKTVVVYPSIGFGAAAGLITLTAGLAGGGGLAALSWGLIGATIGTIAGALLTVPPFLFFGAPIFARRKLKGAAQKARLRLARRRFDKERHELPAAPEDDDQG